MKGKTTMRKIDTYNKLHNLGLDKCLVKQQEFMPMSEEVAKLVLGRYFYSIKKTHGSTSLLGCRTDHLPSRPSDKRKLPILTAESSIKDATLWAVRQLRRGYTVIPSESPQLWVAQGVIRVLPRHINVELDGRLCHTGICRNYDTKLLYAYSGDHCYKGPHKSLVQQLVGIAFEYDLMGYYIEWTLFSKRGLIIWELRDRSFTPLIPTSVVHPMELHW